MIGFWCDKIETRIYAKSCACYMFSIYIFDDQHKPVSNVPCPVSCVGRALWLRMRGGRGGEGTQGGGGRWFLSDRCVTPHIQRSSSYNTQKHPKNTTFNKMSKWSILTSLHWVCLLSLIHLDALTGYSVTNKASMAIFKLKILDIRWYFWKPVFLN